ncbi:hypothetical protein Tco_0360203 [Tanacetum coccineum]
MEMLWVFTTSFCLPEWIGAEVQEEPHHDVRPTLQRLLFYCTPPIATDVVILDPTPKDLAASNPNAKVVANAEASQNTTRPNLFADDSGNQGGGSTVPAAEGPNTRGNGIMNDVDAAPSSGASRPRASSGHASSFRDVSEDAIHREFFPFSPGPYYATYHEGGIVGNYEFTRQESVSNTRALAQKFLASDEFSKVQVELLSLAASAGFERELGMQRTKEEFAAVLKKISHLMRHLMPEQYSRDSWTIEGWFRSGVSSIGAGQTRTMSEGPGQDHNNK